MTIGDAFLSAAQDAFAFLVTERGFRIAAAVAPPSVASNLSGFALTFVGHDRGGQTLTAALETCPVRIELDLALGRGQPRDLENTISIYELLAVESPHSRLELRWGVYAAFGNPVKMQDQYRVLANALQEYGARFFAGNPSLWEDVQGLRREQQRRLTLADVSRAAEAAFQRQDWFRAVELLEALGDQRTPLQAARLSYVKRHTDHGR